MNRAILIGMSAAVLVGAFAALGQGQGRLVKGPEKEMFGAKVSSWARLDAAGKVIEAGVTMPMSAIEKAPLPSHDGSAAGGHGSLAPELILGFPEAVKKTTFLDHLQLWWQGTGHPPERYLTPHFDLHFFGVPAAEVAKIDCKNLTPPALELTPKGFAPAVPPGANAADFCVPLMGFHAIELGEFGAPGQLKPGLFDAMMIAGFYNNKYLFTEPMITREFLLAKRSYRTAVAHPAKAGRKTLYPTQFRATYDAKANAYQFVYSDFKAGQ